MFFVSGRRFPSPRDRCFRCRPPSVSSSTADDLIPQVTYLPDPRPPANSQVTERVSEWPTAAYANELEDEIAADGYDYVSHVRDFDINFFTQHGEAGPRTVP